MKFTKYQPNVHRLDVTLKDVKDVFRLGVFTDVHFDSQYCHRNMFKRHLEEADGILLPGDLFDVMGCHKDPRSKPENIRPEYIRKDKGYLDAVVEDAYEFLKPYANKILLLGRGNHETAIQKHRDTDILDRLSFLLRMNSESQVDTGGYSGFVRMVFRRGQKTSLYSNILFYHHGYGGSAKRSKGVLNSQIDSFMVPQADIIVSGHTHAKLHDPSNERYYLGSDNKIHFKSMDWIKCGSYKRDDSMPGYGGWEVEKGFAPTKMGGYFIDFQVNTVDGEKEPSLKRTVIEAK